MPSSRAPLPPLRTVLVLGLGLVIPGACSGCWRPAPVELPPSHIHAAEPAADDAEAAADPAAEAPDAPALNPDPDGLDPYKAVTVNSPVTVVDDGGKPVTVINSKGVQVEVRQEDGKVRRKVYCASCAPAVEGWVRTEDIAVAGNP